jgi:hypothetical protein
MRDRNRGSPVILNGTALWNSRAEKSSLGCMAARIEVEQASEGEFRVRVIEGRSETLHRVTLKPEDYERLAKGRAEPRELIRRSFEFLLENEPKESILARFDLSVIGRYFPQFEREIKRRLGGS